MIAKRILVLSRTMPLVREVQAAAGAGCSVSYHERLTDLDARLAADEAYDLVVAGPVADTRAGLARMARLRAEHPGTHLVLALSDPPRSPLQDIVRTGAVDLVQLPASRQALRGVLRRALETEHATVAAGIAEAATQATGERLGDVFTVASPSGGCGKTFYSTNLAYHLQRVTGQRVCLVDLDLQFGEVSAALRLKPRYTMTDAVTRSELDDVEVEEHVEEYLLQHSAGFWVLPAPRTPEEADRVTPPDVIQVVAALRRHFGYVVLDTSAQLSEIVLAAMDQSTQLLCMATLDLPSIRNMRVFIETLEKLKVPTDAISVVLNKVEADMGIRIEEANEALHGKIISVLPYAREVSRSINEGVPVLMSAPKALISTQLTAGIIRTSGIGAAPEQAPGPAGRRRLFSRRGVAPPGPPITEPVEPGSRRRLRGLPWNRAKVLGPVS